MKSKAYKKNTLSRPKDKSLEAYKAWMTELAERLTTEKTGIKWTEKEWIENWKKFWKEKPPG
jgi:hypothetical protein